MKKQFVFLLAFFTALTCTRAQVLLTESFENATFPPTGWSIFNNGTGNNWTHNTTNAGFVSQGTSSMTYWWISTDAADTWAFTPGLALNAGDSLVVKFDYVVASSNYPERLKVTVGQGQNVAVQTSVLWVDSNLVNQTFMTGTAGVRIASNGTYNFAFNCFSLQDEYVLAVDNISIERIPANNLKIHPYGGATVGCSFSAGEEISIDIENIGASTQQNFPVAYQINNGPIVSEMVTDPVPPGAVYNFIFNTGADFSAPGTYQMKLFTQLATDIDRTNDTTAATITSQAFGQLARTSVDTAFIPDNDPAGVVSPIPFCGLPSPLGSIIHIKRLTVVSIIHTYCDDLTLHLISPYNDTLTVARHVGGGYDNYPTITFTDTASVNIFAYDNGPLAPGYFHTQDSIGFAKFNGQDPNGMWRLFITDDAAIDVGYLTHWTLEFASAVGIHSYSSEDNLVHVYPNPNNGVFTVESAGGKTNVEVYTIGGQLLESVSLPATSAKQTIDLCKYSSGMYFVKATTANGIQTTKVIVE